MLLMKAPRVGATQLADSGPRGTQEVCKTYRYPCERPEKGDVHELASLQRFGPRAFERKPRML